MFMLLFSYMWGFAAPKKEDGHDVAGAESLRQDLAVGHRIWFDPIITLTVLAAVNLIYVLFVAVQFSYLFGAWQGNLPEGMTYAEQARSGFFELITVALINLLILTLTLTLSRWDNSTLQRWNRALLTALVVCTGIMLISAFIRLQLYEQVYGYTYSRFLSHAFMIYLAALLLLAGIRIWRPAVSLIRTFVLTSLLAYTLINYIGMDRMIADLNIRQYHKTGILDTAYLQSLSDEAIGRMIVFHRETGMLGEHLTQRHESLMQETRSILSYNLSRHLAYKALEREL